MSSPNSTLYLVATPIGNLQDFSPRALATLRGADRIYAEDTRHCRPLLSRFGIDTPALSFHEHNEAKREAEVLEFLQGGGSAALISDAGTPAISDPGFALVRACHEQGLRVVPIPGPCAVIAALSAAGLPTDRFAFDGFLPRKPAARRQSIESMRHEPRTLVVYESAHRILDALRDLAEILGEQRMGALAKELTKLHERIIRAPFGEILRRLEAEPELQKGEFVLLIEGAPQAADDTADRQAEQTLRLLIEEGLPTKQAAHLTARLTGAHRNPLYKRALELRGDT